MIHNRNESNQTLSPFPFLFSFNETKLNQRRFHGSSSFDLTSTHSNQRRFKSWAHAPTTPIASGVKLLLYNHQVRLLINIDEDEFFSREYSFNEMMILSGASTVWQLPYPKCSHYIYRMFHKFSRSPQTFCCLNIIAIPTKVTSACHWWYRSFSTIESLGIR